MLCDGATLCSELESFGEVSRLFTGSAVCGQQSGGQQTLHHRQWSALPTYRVSLGVTGDESWGQYYYITMVSLVY